MEPRNLIVLGSTGTIGRLTLEVARRHPDEIRVVGLSGGRNVDALARQAAEHQVRAVAVADPALLGRLRAAGGLPADAQVLAGSAGLAALAAWPEAGIVVNAIVGAAGLEPTLVALQRGARVGLANKESLVMAGHLVAESLAQHGGEIVPIDSEHSALWQCLQGRDRGQVRRLILTASGGPFRGLAAEALERVTAQEALRHPRWRMGRRITIDSATLFNKGMELIEARWLFDWPFSRLEAVVHPQAIVHGLVELADGSLLAHLSRPDMRLPIQLARSLPARWEPPGSPWELIGAEALTFEKADERSFPCLALARAAGERGGLAPAVANAADEVLVAAFLEGRLSFTGIARGLERVLGAHRPTGATDLAEIMAADAWARAQAEAFVDEAPSR